MVMAATAGNSHYSAADANYINLSRLLDRLEHNLLSNGGDQFIQKSSFERSKVGANLEHARTILIRLEQENGNVHVQTRKSTIQADLQSKRLLLKSLQNRLYELNQDESHDLDSASDDEDIIAKYAPAIADTSSGVDIVGQPPNHLSKREEVATAAANLSSTLRSRTAQLSAHDTGTSTSNAFQTQTHQAAKRILLSSEPTQPALSTTEALMNHHSAEQEDLTNSLLNLATALKNSTLSFADTLATSNPLVDRATGSLDKSATGMEAAERKMGTLRRMTEGKGLWGRWLLYAYIGGLWVAALVIVFVLPKLRF